MKLHHASGNRRYLELSREFVERRGRRPYYFDREAQARGEPVPDDNALRYQNRQAHLPVREQTEAVGHAVRAMYLYSALADLARELPDPSLLETCKTLWESVCSPPMPTSSPATMPGFWADAWCWKTGAW